MPSDMEETEIFMAKNKPSDIVYEVIEAIKAAEANWRYKIDMAEWFSPPLFFGRCTLCAAGAYAVSKCSEKKPFKNYEGHRFLSSNSANSYLTATGHLAKISNVPRRVLFAIDELRQGNMYSFFCYLDMESDLRITEDFLNKWSTSLYYQERRKFFFSHLKDFTKALQDIGL